MAVSSGMFVVYGPAKVGVNSLTPVIVIATVLVVANAGDAPS